MPAAPLRFCAPLAPTLVFRPARRHAVWKEEEHPRNKAGEFKGGGGAGGVAKAKKETGLTVSKTLGSDIKAALNKDPASGSVQRRQAVVHFSNTPKILAGVGMPADAKIISDVRRIRKMANAHHLTAEQIAALPGEYAAPVAVFKEGDGFLAVTTITAENQSGDKRPVLVFLRPDHGKDGDTFIASAYAPNSPREKQLLERDAKSGMLLYVDDEKAAKLEDETKFSINTSNRRPSSNNAANAGEVNPEKTNATPLVFRRNRAAPAPAPRIVLIFLPAPAARRSRPAPAPLVFLPARPPDLRLSP
jgi:hypothetical protein